MFYGDRFMHRRRPARNDPTTNVSQKNQRQNIHSRDLNELSVEVCHVQGKFYLVHLREIFRVSSVCQFSDFAT